MAKTPELASAAPRFGVMYHLTSSGPVVWKRDFETLAAGGFHRVVLWEINDELDRVARALELCADAGLRGYYVSLNPILLAERILKSGRPHERHRCVGIDGQTLRFYNPFHRASRRATLLPYLRRIAGALRGSRALGGYFLDDVMDAESMISYTPADARAFRGYLKERYACLDALGRAWGRRFRGWEDVTPPRDTRAWDPRWRRAWQDWVDARQSWWLDWAADVRAAMNPGPEHELILGDDWYSVRYGHDVAGGFTPEFVRRFDAFSYDYTHGVHYLDPGMTNLDRDWAAVRELAGGMKATIFLKAAAKTGEPFPDAKWTLAHSERCLRNGVDGIDYYIYRAWKGNYAYRNGLADNPKVFREIAAFARANRG